jgi:hypothetical protein
MVFAVVIKERWKAAMLVVSVIIFLPGISAMYMLTFIMIPLLFFVDQEGKRYRDCVYLVLFMLLIAFLPVTTIEPIVAMRLEGERFTLISIVQQGALLLMFILLFIEGAIASVNALRKAITHRTEKPKYSPLHGGM